MSDGSEPRQRTGETSRRGGRGGRTLYEYGHSSSSSSVKRADADSSRQGDSTNHSDPPGARAFRRAVGRKARGGGEAGDGGSDRREVKERSTVSSASPSSLLDRFNGRQITIEKNTTVDSSTTVLVRPPPTTPTIASRPASAVASIASRPISTTPVGTGTSNPFFTCIKVIDENLRLQTELVQRYMSEQPGCFIIGVLGRRGVGKSWVMNVLSSSGTAFPVPPQHGSERGKAGPATVGVDLHITQERILLLDTQAVVTPRYRGRGGAEIGIASEHITMLMFSICHMILVVSDAMKDEDLWAFLKKIEMTKLKAETGGDSGNEKRGNASGGGEDVYFPEVIFVCNKAKPEDFSPESHARCRDALTKAFRGSRLRTMGAIRMADTFPQYEKLTPGNTAEEPNLWILPFITPEKSRELPRGKTKEADTSPKPKQASQLIETNQPASQQATRNFLEFDHATFRESIESDRLLPARGPVLCTILRNAIFETPRFTWIPPPIPNVVHLTVSGTDMKSPMISETPALVTVGAAKKWFQVSEREWFRSAVKIWDVVRSNRDVK
ncbi:smg-9, nonsense mediated mRNA decay factor [Dinochytrium kinnereticum]|nr:smg-9, nonsense mediated mRNA decay factor [Dinochytrium kinnereticum]